MLLTEWGVQGMDVSLKSPAAQLYTQKERGRGYEKVLRQVVDNQGRPYRDYLAGMISAVQWLDGYLK